MRLVIGYIGPLQAHETVSMFPQVYVLRRHEEHVHLLAKAGR